MKVGGLDVQGSSVHSGAKFFNFYFFKFSESRLTPLQAWNAATVGDGELQGAGPTVAGLKGPSPETFVRPLLLADEKIVNARRNG